MVQRLILVFLATQSAVKCSVTTDESENEIGVDGKLKKGTISGIGTCTSEDCFEFKPQVYIPHSPLIPCDKVWSDFYECETPLDLKGNQTARDELGYGCTKFGGQKFEDVLFTQVNCTVLPNIECYGNRTFALDVPCIKYSGHYFVTTLLYSIFLGFLGMDRFSLGHTGTAVGKLLTLGGVGIWWLVDIVLLVTGHLTPEDGSSWMPVA